MYIFCWFGQFFEAGKGHQNISKIEHKCCKLQVQRIVFKTNNLSMRRLKCSAIEFCPKPCPESPALVPKQEQHLFPLRWMLTIDKIFCSSVRWPPSGYIVTWRASDARRSFQRRCHSTYPSLALTFQTWLLQIEINVRLWITPIVAVDWVTPHLVSPFVSHQWTQTDLGTLGLGTLGHLRRDQETPPASRSVKNCFGPDD